MSKNRIEDSFDRLKQSGHKAFIAYITAGDPSPSRTAELVWALERGGADIIELGIPFSDPVADGPVIQQAFGRALEADTTIATCMEIVREIRRTSQIPLVFFTYYNPVLAYGFERFVTDAVTAGADGLLLLDLPPEEAGQEMATCATMGLSWITLVAPTTPAERARRLAGTATGFVYYVSREGVTGERDDVATSVPERVAMLRSHASAPVCVGFGISRPDQVAQIASVSDGAIVGSALVKVIAAHATSPDLPSILEQTTRLLSAPAHR